MAVPPGAWTVAVESRSSLPWAFIDWGQNRRNVRAYFQYLAEELARQPASAPYQAIVEGGCTG